MGRPDVDILSSLIGFLEGLSHNPVEYSIVFFLYAVAATVFLPIPVEVGLFFSPATPDIVKALVLGLGKAVGSVVVFKLGGTVSGPFDRLLNRNRWSMKFMDLMHRFVARTRYVGLYLILSVPLMVDTVPLYLFSLFNEEGVLKLRYFALTNFLAGITRASIVFALFMIFGIKAV
jgi:hypothetical protein